MLELVEARRRRVLRSVTSYSVGIALVVIVGLVILMSSPAGTDLRTDPVPYVIGGAVWAISTATAYLIRRTHTVYAGATWAGDNEDRDKLVSTYDLTRIKVFGVHGPDTMLQLIGPDGFFLQLPLGLLEGNPQLWNLIYNGLRHSAATCAQVDAITRDLLHLPKTHRATD
jgi:hypothetical protein